MHQLIPTRQQAGPHASRRGGAGWYHEAGLDVTLLSPHTDAYKTTPGQRVAAGEADLAIAPAETVISSHTQPAGSTRPKLTVRCCPLQPLASNVLPPTVQGIPVKSVLT